jgi:hypothetical protein
VVLQLIQERSREGHFVTGFSIFFEMFSKYTDTEEISKNMRFLLTSCFLLTFATPFGMGQAYSPYGSIPTGKAPIIRHMARRVGVAVSIDSVEQIEFDRLEGT